MSRGDGRGNGATLLTAVLGWILAAAINIGAVFVGIWVVTRLGRQSVPLTAVILIALAAGAIVLSITLMRRIGTTASQLGRHRPDPDAPAPRGTGR